MDKENETYTYCGILFSLKKEGNTAIGKTWMNQEDMLNKISQSQKDKYSMIPLILGI